MTQQSTATRILGIRVARYRKGLGWSQTRLAEECAAAGLDKWDRSMITNLEIGRRQRISVEEWLVFSLVLDVPPLMLLIPLGEAQEYPVCRDLSVNPDTARRWVEGMIDATELGWQPAREASEAWSDAVRPLALYRRLDEAQRRAAQELEYLSTARRNLPTRLKDAQRRCFEAHEEYGRLLSRLVGQGLAPPPIADKHIAYMREVGIGIPNPPVSMNGRETPE